MEQTRFFEHFRICTRKDGSPREVRRSGAAINYKAIDTRTSEPVMLQLIPIATVDEAKREQFIERVRVVQKLDHINIARVLDVLSDRDHIGVVSEYVEGETTESWLATNGTMAADAVLRVGLQVVRALAAAAFHRLAHHAIQPSNIVIVPGQSADGGWPLIKLINFGLSSLDISSDGAEAREIASTGPSQSASPEQLAGRALDFRSEIYSLGATMCFLLTGAVPLAASGLKARLRARRLPELRRAPGALRNLLVHMLREDPENRPQDPVAFEAEMRDCLTKIERRQAIGRKLGIPLAAVVPRRPRSTSPTPFRQVVRGTVAFAALLVAAVVVAAFFLPEDKVPFLHRSDSNIGVAVGVPESGQSPVAQNLPASSIPAASVTAAPVAAATSAPAEQAQVQPPPQVATAESTASPEPPSESPPESSRENDESSESQTPEPARNKNEVAETTDGTRAPEPRDEPTESSEPATSAPPVARNKTPVIASARRSTSPQPRFSQTQPNRRTNPIIQFPNGTPLRARVVRTLPDGRVILRLPSGKTVVAVPEGSRWAPLRQYHRRVIDRGVPMEPGAPYQPFDPGYPND